MNAENLQEARERKGAAAEDRPAEVDEILEPKERIGYKNELPLLDREYSAYPEGDDILRPEAGKALETLADHPLVSSAEDMSDELGTTTGKVEQAAELHGVAIPDGFDVEVSTSRLDTLVGGIPEGMVSPENPILTAILYVEKGLGTGEVADILEGATDKHTVREADVTQTLIDAGVLEGETTAEAQYRRKQNRGEVSGYNNGVTIDTTNL
jgi:hypothetical protein